MATQVCSNNWGRYTGDPQILGRNPETTPKLSSDDLQCLQKTQVQHEKATLVQFVSPLLYDILWLYNDVGVDEGILNIQCLDLVCLWG